MQLVVSESTDELMLVAETHRPAARTCEQRRAEIAAELRRALDDGNDTRIQFYSAMARSAAAREGRIKLLTDSAEGVHRIIDRLNGNA